MLPLDDDTLLRLLKEDIPYGDLTTRSLGIGAMPGLLTMRARGPMTVCGSEEAARIFALLGAKAEVLAPTGARVAAGAPLARVEGRAEALHSGWKVAQTLTEWASGIATSATAIVDAARAVAPAIAVACTRKPAPATRALSLRAVVAGGAQVHRTGLSDTVLLFAEHRAFGGPDALHAQIALLRDRCPERRVVVEVETLDEARRAAQAGADVIQLEKFAPEAVADTAAALTDWPGCLAAAGGINATNAAAYAQTGANVLVTSAPYYAKPADVSVTIEPA
ncbi:ModD protein [Rhodovulum adriaticum]|uniref:Putative pyrophosphorylase ModD n=1 Tax=Rhodovulum adriaticum TaxID=35804 RepID=A0A4V2SLF7_RHOAD|nr:ModD protein [Rhodovulum adriaticum]MBK1634386.1 ModD protein [Rhodovulum adriaticum]TCP23246.1 molybdenum transport protein [Rhodovulum adriaticum]